MLFEGIGINAICRLTGLSKSAVLNVLTIAGERCQRVLDAKIKNIEPTHVELDELYSFVYSRPDNTPVEETERGEFYCFLSLDRNTKLILNHLIGRRNGETATAFLKDLQWRIPSRFQLSTDGWGCYTGFDSRISKVFGDTIDHGSEIKQFGNLIPRNSTPYRVMRRFNPIVCQWVKRKALKNEAGKILRPPITDTISISEMSRDSMTFFTLTKSLQLSGNGGSIFLPSKLTGAKSQRPFCM